MRPLLLLFLLASAVTISFAAVALSEPDAKRAVCGDIGKTVSFTLESH